MRVLVVETDAGEADGAAGLLTSAGHEVVRCHDVDSRAFPCRALRHGACPLDDGGVDVALDVRGAFSPRPTAREDGVSCALRRHVPLVVAGSRLRNPFADWADEAIDGVDDVVAACERAAPRATGHAAVARDVVGVVLERAGRSPDTVRVEVERARQRLRVRLHTNDDLESDLRNRLVIEVHRALRAFDRYAAGFDVVVQPRTS